MNFILAILSSLLIAAAFPTVFGQVRLPNLGFLAWVALVPLFFAIRNAAPRRAFGLTFLASIVWYFVSLGWLYTALTTYGHLDSLVSIGVLTLMMVILATYISLAPMMAAWVEKRLGIGRFWTIPLFWVALEFSRNYLPCNGFPWGNITNSQYAYLPIIQVVDVAGVYGLTYVMVVVNCAVTLLCCRAVWNSKKIVFACALFIATLVYGYTRLHFIDKEQSSWPSIRVAALQGNIPQDDKGVLGEEVLQLIPYRKYTEMLKTSGVNLIIWPESAYPWVLLDNKKDVPPALLGLDGAESYLLTGVLTEQTGVRERTLYNSMMLLDSGGNIIGRYYKSHLVPFGEHVPYKKLLFFAKKLVAPVGNFAVGKDLTPLYTDDYQIGGLVCYEDIFPEIARTLTRNGANFLAVITNDAWYGRSSAAFQHLAISVFRAVENRRWMIKAANSGLSAMIDAKGQIISKTDIFEEGMIVANMKLGVGNSLYTKYGDWFAWMCVAICACIVSFSGITRLKYDIIKRTEG